MTETSSLRPSDAIKPDGFVDFYELLGAPPTTSPDALRDRINALYAEAQANRDHRNLSKRRDYELMLELLPFARTVLLDADKRLRYDAYADDARAGLASTDFETFMDTLTGKADTDAEERASLLGVAATGTRDTSQNASLNGAVAQPSGKSAPKPKPAASREVAPNARVVSAAPTKSGAGAPAIAFSVALFVAGLIVGGLVLGSWPLGLILGGVLGAAGFFMASKKANSVA